MHLDDVDYVHLDSKKQVLSSHVHNEMLCVTSIIDALDKLGKQSSRKHRNEVDF